MKEGRVDALHVEVGGWDLDRLTEFLRLPRGTPWQKVMALARSLMLQTHIQNSTKWAPRLELDVVQAKAFSLLFNEVLDRARQLAPDLNTGRRHNDDDYYPPAN